MSCLMPALELIIFNIRFSWLFSLLFLLNIFRVYFTGHLATPEYALTPDFWCAIVLILWSFFTIGFDYWLRCSGLLERFRPMRAPPLEARAYHYFRRCQLSPAFLFDVTYFVSFINTSISHDKVRLFRGRRRHFELLIIIIEPRRFFRLLISFDADQFAHILFRWLKLCCFDYFLIEDTYATIIFLLRLSGFALIKAFLPCQIALTNIERYLLMLFRLRRWPPPIFPIRRHWFRFFTLVTMSLYWCLCFCHFLIATISDVITISHWCCSLICLSRRRAAFPTV